MVGLERMATMKAKTCAACDCALGPTPIVVRLGGHDVEVCCEECAVQLKEADASARGRKRG
jgi:hypothetical protein